MSNYLSTGVSARDGFVSSRASGMASSSTVRIADLASKMRDNGDDVIDLSAGRASESTDREICTAAEQAFHEGDTHQTPACGTPSYLKAVAEKLRRENTLEYSWETEITATLGCKNGLVLALSALVDPGDEVIVEDPCFVSYAPTIELVGGKAVPVQLDPENRWQFKLEELRSAINHRTKAIIVCSPGNPTGIVHSESDLKNIAEIAIENDLVVISDEIYEAVTWGGRRYTPIASLYGMRERVIGLMGMTKSYAMGGWRIGYAYGDSRIISRMSMMQAHLMTCASSIGQRAAAHALSADVTNRLRETVWRDWEARCAWFCNELASKTSMKVTPPEGGFYAWADISAYGLSSENFATGLLKQEKVAIVPGGTFGQSTDNYVRLTCVKSKKDIRTAAARIEKYCASLQQE